MPELKWHLGAGIDPMREWMRRDLPKPSEGLVLTDIDLAVRRYGKRFGTDAEGDLMLVEMKERDLSPTAGEAYVLRWLDKAIGTGHYSQRYRGSHVLKVAYDLSLIPTCPACGAREMSADQAYRVGLYAQVYLEDQPVSHEALAKLLVGQR
jgi:hypothetical protein